MFQCPEGRLLLFNMVEALEQAQEVGGFQCPEGRILLFNFSGDEIKRKVPLLPFQCPEGRLLLFNYDRSR